MLTSVENNYWFDGRFMVVKGQLKQSIFTKFYHAQHDMSAVI